MQLDQTERGISMLTIGEFSRSCGLTVKTLRFYHEQGLLVPSFVDPNSGYRYYAWEQLETARLIAQLRKLEFPLAEIQQLLKQATNDEQLLRLVEEHKSALQEKIASYRKAVKALEQFIAQERQAKDMADSDFQVQEKTLEPMLVAGIKMKGRYSDCGKAFARISRAFGRHLCGKPLMLHYDEEYREDDANFEPCMPVRQAKQVPEISVRELAGGRCVSLVHKGPYEQLGRSYAKITKYIKEKNYQIVTPTREVYLKGPGMIFKGNPANYLTEIQMLVQA